MYEPVDLLEKIRLLLIRKRGPKRQAGRDIHSVPPEHATVA
jgi:hypothetical protein